MDVTYDCPVCGTALPPATRSEFCPVCTLNGVLDPDTSGAPAAGPLRLGDYELVEEIARGGAGVVYRARQLTLGRTVAVKLLLGGQFASPAARQRFQTEATAAASLRHPNIVTIIEIGECDGQPWLAMELMDGGTLADCLRDGPMVPRAAAQTVVKLAGAVQLAHEAGILHRDLKPSNVLLDSFGEPRVTDFGLAKVAASDGDAEVTLSGQILGSPSFMAPEQATGRNGQIDARADVYALGAILYQLLTARPPFQSDSAAATLRLVESEEPLRPRQLNPNVPPDLENIVLKCLAKSVARRYATAAELAADLGRFLDGDTVRARPVGVFVRAKRWGRRHPVVSLALALLLLFSAGATLAAISVRRAEQRALANLREAQMLAYVRDIALADRAIEDGELARTRDLLKSHLPREGEPDRRSFEWHLLWRYSESQASAVLRGHEQVVSSLALLPDGKLASGSWDGSVCVWDTATHAQLERLTDYRGRIWAVDAQGGHLLAMGEGGLVVWDTGSWQVVWQRAGKYSYGNARFVHAGQSIVVATRKGGEVWSLADGAGAPVKLDGVAGPVAVSPDGKSFATHSGPVVQLWDAESLQLKVKNTIAGMNSFGLGDVAFSPDGKKLAIGSSDGDVAWLPVETPDEEHLVRHTYGRKRQNPHLGWVANLAYSADGKWLASVAADHQVIAWNAERSSSARVLRGHEHEVWAACWLADGHTLATAGKDETICLWDLSQRAPSRVLRWRTIRTVWDDTELLAVTKHKEAPLSRLTIYDWKLRKQTRELSLPGFDQASGQPFFLPDRGLVGFGDKSGQFAVYDLREAEPKRIAVMALGARFYGGAFSPDGKLCATVTSRGDTALWEIGDAETSPRKRLDLPGAGRVFALDADYLVTVPGVNTPRVFDARSGRVLADLPGQKEDVSAAVILPGGRTLATAGWDGFLRLWGLPDGGFIEKHRLQRAGIYALALSPDHQTLAVGGQDGVTRFWNIATREETMRWLESRYVSGLWFTPDGHALVIKTDADVRVIQATPTAER